MVNKKLNYRQSNIIFFLNVASHCSVVGAFISVQYPQDPKQLSEDHINMCTRAGLEPVTFNVVVDSSVTAPV